MSSGPTPCWSDSPPGASASRRTSKARRSTWPPTPPPTCTARSCPWTAAGWRDDRGLRAQSSGDPAFEAAGAPARERVVQRAAPALYQQVAAVGQAGEHLLDHVHRQRGPQRGFDRGDASTRVPDRHEQLLLSAGTRTGASRSPAPEQPSSIQRDTKREDERRNDQGNQQRERRGTHQKWTHNEEENQRSQNSYDRAQHS